MSKRSKQGIVLMALLVAVVVVGSIGIGTIMVHRSAQVERTHTMRQRSALGLAQAGMQWSMKHFGADDDWIAQAAAINGVSVNMEPGYFEVGIPAVLSSSVTIEVTGNVQFKKVIVARTMQITLYKKLETGGGEINVGVTGNFALFLANHIKLFLENTQIKGDVYN
ncbi:MAG: hypothetical protein ABIH39_04090, partial [Candidatus Margulisiibacteriota bacterium]